MTGAHRHVSWQHIHSSWVLAVPSHNFPGQMVCITSRRKMLGQKDNGHGCSSLISQDILLSLVREGYINPRLTVCVYGMCIVGAQSNSFYGRIYYNHGARPWIMFGYGRILANLWRWRLLSPPAVIRVTKSSAVDWSKPSEWEEKSLLRVCPWKCHVCTWFVFLIYIFGLCLNSVVLWMACWCHSTGLGCAFSPALEPP